MQVKSGNFLPRVCCILVAMLAEPNEGDRIFDPACGSGGFYFLLVLVEKQGISKNYAFYGQESTGSTYQLARINMFSMAKIQLGWNGAIHSIIRFG